jgi:hypothetical protein
MEFDAAGNFVKGWGGPGEGYDWPEQEHCAQARRQRQHLLRGNGAKDQMLLKFTTDGKFRQAARQLGHADGQ